MEAKCRTELCQLMEKGKGRKIASVCFGLTLEVPEVINM